MLKNTSCTSTLNAPLLMLVGLLMLSMLVSCDRLYGSKTVSSLSYNIESFARTSGKKVPYSLYAPSNLEGWAFNSLTAMTFDTEQESYIKWISLDKPAIDYGGLRFKISGLEWNHQIGFGEFTVPDVASTVGVTNDRQVFPLVFAKVASADMHFEVGENALDGSNGKRLRIALKILAEADPHADAMLCISVE